MDPRISFRTPNASLAKRREDFSLTGKVGLQKGSSILRICSSLSPASSTPSSVFSHACRAGSHDLRQPQHPVLGKPAKPKPPNSRPQQANHRDGETDDDNVRDIADLRLAITEDGV
jgi:hypothetical protein